MPDKYIELRNNNGYQYVTRLIGKDGAVVVIPWKLVYGEMRFQLILSHRPTFDKPILEFPAGLIDHEGESIFEVALRELKEETGWSGWANKDWYNPLPSPSSAGLSDELLYFVSVELKTQSDNCLQGEEKLEVLPLMTITEIKDFITEHTVNNDKDDFLVSSRLLTFLAGAYFGYQSLRANDL